MPRKNKKEMEDSISDFMFYCESKNLRKKTMMSYEATLKLFYRYLQDNFKVEKLDAITDKMCIDYINYTKERGKYTFVADDDRKNFNNPFGRSDYGKKISITTINNYIRNLKVFFNYLLDERIIKRNPMDFIKELKSKRIPKDQLTDEEFNKIIKCLDLTKFSEYRDYIVIQLIMDSGMRVGECLSITIKDIDLNNRAILISGEIAKGRKDRFVFYSYTMSKMLRRWLDYKDRYTETDLLFCTRGGNHVTVGNFETNFNKYIRRARIHKNISPHVLRNNFGRRFLLAGGSIFELSKILGHSSVTVTETAYADLMTEDIRKKYQHFSPLENMKKKNGDEF